MGFRLVSWAGWLPGAEGLASGGAVRPGAALPSSLRRRVTPIGRKALEAAWLVLAGRSEDEEPPRIVLSSRHGEYGRTMGLLDSLAESGEVSPAEFSLAVHHGLAGLLSIAAGNRAGHSAVAGGGESFGYGWLEAAASLADGGGRVLLIHFDEPLPEPYAPVGGDRDPSVALALLLASDRDEAEGDRLSLAFAPSDPPGDESPAVSFARLLDGQAAEAVCVGERLTWRWCRVA
jgi:hypothetical protein